MPEVLTLCKHAKLSRKFDEWSRGEGIRVKSVLTTEHALEWIKLLSVNLFIVDGAYSAEELAPLLSELWKESPLPHCLVVDGDSSAESGAFRILGAEVVNNTKAKKRIQTLLALIEARSKAARGVFDILIVEDLDSPRDIICAYIEGLQLGSVHGVGSAKEAMALLESTPERFSCVITDVRMPEVTGEMLIAHIRSHAKLKHLPIIVLTAYGTVDSLVGCLKAGASGFLVKPPKKADLIRELGRAHRIINLNLPPRLASSNDIDELREVLFSKGFS